MSRCAILGESKTATREAISWGKKEKNRIMKQEEAKKQIIFMIKQIRLQQKKNRGRVLVGAV